MLSPSPSYQKCSRAGCLSHATNQLIWRNPKIHLDERTKTWLACAEHLDFLIDYLEVRGFFLDSKVI
jgi:hypothetical protein